MLNNQLGLTELNKIASYIKPIVDLFNTFNLESSEKDLKCIINILKKSNDIDFFITSNSSQEEIDFLNNNYGNIKKDINLHYFKISEMIFNAASKIIDIDSVNQSRFNHAISLNDLTLNSFSRLKNETFCSPKKHIIKNTNNIATTQVDCTKCIIKLFGIYRKNVD